MPESRSAATTSSIAAELAPRAAAAVWPLVWTPKDHSATSGTARALPLPTTVMPSPAAPTGAASASADAEAAKTPLSSPPTAWASPSSSSPAHPAAATAARARATATTALRFIVPPISFRGLTPGRAWKFPGDGYARAPLRPGVGGGAPRGSRARSLRRRRRRLGRGGDHGCSEPAAGPGGGARGGERRGGRPPRGRRRLRRLRERRRAPRAGAGRRRGRRGPLGARTAAGHRRRAPGDADHLRAGHDRGGRQGRQGRGQGQGRGRRRRRGRERRRQPRRDDDDPDRDKRDDHGGGMSVATLAEGRYLLERELGRGGMATVHLARDSELDRPVAVKVLAGHLSGDEDLRERFVREARMAAGLSHPNVVQVFDAGEEDGRLFIVMEYVPGVTLADELSRAGRLAPAAAVDLALQACAGLEHAHETGLVHRDVKPGNLLLREDGALKITDFGIARAVEATQLTQIGSVLGTAAYLSPEQAVGERVTAATDIYGLGVVLYELLTGRTPFVIESLGDLVAKHRESAVTPVRELEPAVPEALEAAVMKCLARNPDYRPESAAALARELAAASPEPPTVPLPPSSGVRATEIATAPLGAPPPPAPAATAIRPRRARRDFALPRRGF